MGKETVSPSARAALRAATVRVIVAPEMAASCPGFSGRHAQVKRHTRLSTRHLRTSEARARGVKMGRPPKLTPHQIKEALRRRNAGEPMRDIARTYNVSHSTISRLGAGPRHATVMAVISKSG